MKEVLLTQEGLNELKQRLDELVIYQRTGLSEKLQHARSLGDLSENAEYDAAKQEESEVAQEIKDIEERIKNAKIIEKGSSGKISMGHTVTVEYLGDVDDDEDRVMTVQIVGETEADYIKGKISNESPLGKALLGKRTGSTVAFLNIHGGEEKYKVISVK